MPTNHERLVWGQGDGRGLTAVETGSGRIGGLICWENYMPLARVALYAGGEQIRANATEYLIRRNKEPGEVYGERLSRVFYENYAGSIIDWYAATVFRREPLLNRYCRWPPV